MQQLRERAAKIVKHLTVAKVSELKGIEVIKHTMEKSPIIKILDTKKVDKRRQKFMRLGRLQGESIESFLNRAEIYRRENQSSPDYTVGSKFYIGHLLDAAKLTKRDLAYLLKAAGGTLEDEEAVTHQLEGLPQCHIGKGETTLDNEEKFFSWSKRPVGHPLLWTTVATLAAKDLDFPKATRVGRDLSTDAVSEKLWCPSWRARKC